MEITMTTQQIGKWALMAAAAAAVAGLGMSDRARGADQLQRMKHNNPGLVVDLGVGLWANPLPMDYDGDGDLDLVVASPDKPYNGIYFFENPGAGGGDKKMPVFKPGVRMAEALQNLQISMVDGKPRILRVGEEMVDFTRNGIDKRVKLPVKTEDFHSGKVRIRANQWRYLDYDGDGRQDLIVGIEDWADYGWDDAFTPKGEWTNGPLRGFIYYLRNTGTNEKPQYEKATRVEAGGKPIDVFGMPSPSFADYDGDGDLDLICGEFLDKLTYFENVGTRTAPKYAAPRPLKNEAGEPIRMDLQMIQVVPVDWTGDGKPDLVVGEEDGRVALVENTGAKSGSPVFKSPVFFKQIADDVKFGALASPVPFDWDGDKDLDIVSGNTAGYIGFIENLGQGAGAAPKWAAPKYLEADGNVIRIMAGQNGSIQGPAEAKWGYTTIAVADWDGDQLPDIVANSIFGKIIWFRNVGTRTAPKLAAAQPVEVAWTDGKPTKPAWTWWDVPGNELHTQWRTTPIVVDANGDKLNDLVMLDRDGFLSLFERRRAGDKLELLPPKHVFRVAAGEPSVFDHNQKPVTFDTDKDGRNDLAGLRGDGKLTYYHSNPMGNREIIPNKHADRANDPAFATDSGTELPLRLAGGWAGRSGRRKLAMTDWDGDGKLDLLVNSTNINFLRNVAPDPGKFMFKDEGPVDTRVLAGHDTSPAPADFDGDGMVDLVVGAEDGLFYFMKNPRAAKTSAAAANAK
jgi:hypothetical protein